jgi:hypothetical protein
VRFLESLQGEQRVKESIQPSADDRAGKRSAWVGAHTSYPPHFVAVTDSTGIRAAVTHFSEATSEIHAP